MRAVIHFTSALAMGGHLASGYAGMGKLVEDVKVAARQSGGDERELLGNLKTLNDDELTQTGKDIKGLLLGQGNPESTEQYSRVPIILTTECRKKDVCCVWKYIANEMEALFSGPSGRCTKWARFAVRLGFHDAGSWDKSLDFGGADGSIALVPAEKTASQNRGLEEMIEQVQKWYFKYHTVLGFSHVTYADLIQVAASVGAVVCPLGPRIRTFVGRPDSNKRNRNDLLPSPDDTADFLIQLFRDKTISPNGLVALVGAHTTSQQRFVDTSRPGAPQDSTPGVWDVLFYPQTLRKEVPKRIFKFKSDERLAIHPETAAEWKAFTNVTSGQRHWNHDYALEYIRLSLLGVQDINGMTECTKVLPDAVTEFESKDQDKIDEWLSTDVYDALSRKIADKLDDGLVIVEDIFNIGDIFSLDLLGEVPTADEIISELDIF